MSSQMFIAKMTIILVVMAIAAAIESFLPLFGRNSGKGRIAANLSITAVTFAFNWALTSVTAIVALKLKPGGLLATMKIPFALEVVLTIALLDFMYGWASHVLLHKIPFLWRVHQVHCHDVLSHSSDRRPMAVSVHDGHGMDVGATLRPRLGDIHEYRPGAACHLRIEGD